MHMLTNEFAPIIHRHPAIVPIFKGVFALDQLPKELDTTEHPLFIIINTE